MSDPSRVRLRPGPGIVLRTPLLPIDTLLEWTAAGAEPEAARRHLAALLERADVREAIFVASPSLHAALDRWVREPGSPAGRQAERALVRYVARMSGRATPFGLFSAVSAGRLGAATSLQLAPHADYRRRTRIDNDYLFQLIDTLLREPAVRAALRYRPSSSLYAAAGRLRYAHARLAGKERSYHLVAVEPTPYLHATLQRAREGARAQALAAALVADDPEVTGEEAAGFVDELIESQILVPDLGVAVTGPEPIDALLAQLGAAGLDAPALVLARARDAIAAIDAAGLGNPPAAYQAVAAGLEPLTAKVEIDRLFQVDMVKPAEATLSSRLADEVARTILWLHRLRPAAEESSLDRFRRAFRDRYEDQVVPLTEALDEESGIGFEVDDGPGAEGSPLLEGLGFPARARGPERAPWGRVEQHMQRRLAAALAGGADEILLADDDLQAMKSDAAPPLPDALSAMIRPCQDAGAGELRFLLEAAGGPSGARLLGRFCHASPEIDAMVRDHLRAEEALRPDALFAEIVHLNEGRLGNILCRPVLREHEIVYLGLSGAPRDRQIAIDDLLVSVRDDRVVLTSRRLGREVVPRLTTAHNVRNRTLGVYRFLAAVQGQGTGGAGWSWGPLGRAPFLPRVRIGNAVVARATWNLGAADLKGLDAPGAVAALRQRCRLPRFVVIAQGDNELPIDLDNPLMVDVFADELAGRKEAVLHELFPAPGSAPVRGPEGSYTGEVVLTFTRVPDKGAAARPAARPATAASLQRSFPPGSSWLYAKIYCGASTTDRVLAQAIAPLARQVVDRGDCRQWFFIRYGDPHHHLRVRFAGEPARLAALLPELDAALAPLVAEGAVWKLQVDTYVRELERYGGDHGIELCEQLFCIDSEAAAEIVELLEGDAGADARWRLALRGSDRLLQALGLSAEQRLQVFAGARDMLGKEHEAGAGFYAQIGERYKREAAALEALLADTAAAGEHDLAPGFDILDRRDARLAELAAELRRRDDAGMLSPRLTGFAWSLVHMHCNRLLHASARAQELVIYDLLRRLHAARRARSAR